MSGFITDSAHGAKGASIFPRQKLTTTEKKKEFGSVEKWGENCILAIDQSMAYNGQGFRKGIQSKTNIRENLNLLEYGIFDTTRYNDIVNPYGAAVKFPVELEHYDIVSNRIEALLGEELLKNVEYRVVNKSSDVASAAQEHKIAIINQFFEAYFQAGVQKAAEQNGEEPIVDTSGLQTGYNGEPIIQGNGGEEITNIDQLLRYAETSFSDMSEIIGNQVLDYLWQDLRLQRLFHNGFRTFFGTGMEVYYVGTKGGEPFVRLVDLRGFDFDISHGNDSVADSQFVREVRYITYADVIDEFYDSLTEDQIEQLESSKGELNVWNDSMDAIRDSETISGIRVARFEWKSLIKIGVVTRIDPLMGEIEEMVDENYKKQVGESIQWYWLPQRWEGTRIGDLIYVNIQPLEFQFRGLDDLSKTFSHYVGIRTNYSLLDKIKPYQYLYNITMYQLKLAFARAKGKGILIDVHQIPVSQGWDIEKWLYYLDMFGIAVINSRERNAEGDVSNFNQFQQFDLTIGNTINSYIMQLEFLKNEVADITGITEQRLGNIKSSETVGGVERSVTQSSAITESLFFTHREAIREVLQAVLDVTKTVWKSGKKVSYILNDLGRKFFELSDDNFLYEDLGVFISNNSKDASVVQMLKQVAQQMLSQKEISLTEFVQMFKSNSMKDLEYHAKEATAKHEQMLQQQQQGQQQQNEMMQQQLQMQQQMEEMKMQIEAEKLKIEQQKLELERYKIDLDAEVKLEIARLKAESDIYAFNQQMNADANQNGILDIYENKRLDLEQKKLELQAIKEQAAIQKQIMDSQSSQQKQAMDMQLQQDKMMQQERALNQKDDQMEQDAILKEEELAIKRQQANKSNTE